MAVASVDAEIRRAASVGAGLAAGVATYGWLALSGHRLADRTVVLALAITAAVALGVATFHVLLPLITRALGALTPRWRRGVLASALLVPGLLAVVTPVHVPVPDYPIELELQPTAVRDREAPGQEIWLQGAVFDSKAVSFEGRSAAWRGGVPLDPDGWIADEGWERRENVWLATSADAGVLRWKGQGGWRSAAFLFTAHPWSGAVEIRQGSRVENVVLTRDPARTATVLFELRPPLPYALGGWLLAGATWALASLGILLVSAFVSLQRPRRAAEIRLPFWGVFALVLLGQLLYLSAFYPALMSWDSIDQWLQGLNGPIDNAHPALHTVLHRIASRTVGTPAVIIVLQQAVYAALIALWVRELGRLGAPAWSLWLTAVFAALWISPGVVNATLWKDVPYSLGVAALTYGLLRQLSTGGEWLGTRRAFVGMAVTMAAVMVLRHNGLLASMATLVALFFLPGNRRRTAVLALAVVGLFLVIRGPLYRLLEVQRTPRSFALQNQVHQMSALVAAGAPVPQEARMLLEAVQPMGAWDGRYYCYTLTPNFYNSTFNRDAFEERIQPFLKALVKLGIAHPRPLLERQQCVTSYVWRILQPKTGYLYTHTAGVEPNHHGLKAEPFNQKWTDFVLRLVRDSKLSAPFLHFAWRPAVWHYLILFGVALAALRLRRARLLWLTVPVLANAASLLVLSPSQSMRYAYAAHLVGMFLLALLLLRPETDAMSKKERAA